MTFAFKSGATISVVAILFLDGEFDDLRGEARSEVA